MPQVRLDSPILKAGSGAKWLKGNLHTHTTRSDGRSDPQEMVRTYAKLGHDFLMLSDHDTLGRPEDLDPCGMVLLRGNEVCGSNPHLLDVGARRRIESHYDRQRVISAVNRTSGFVILCHPNWTENFNHYRYEQLFDLADYAGIEIFNGVVLDLAGSHLAVDKWDRLLAAGKVVWGYANDDAHRLEQVGRACNVVRAKSRTPRAILDALRRGCFYASSGVEIRAIEAKGAVLRVVAPNAEEIAVFAPYGRRVFSVKGRELRYDVSELMAPFIRVECYGRGTAAAWTQPIMIRGGKHEALQKRFASLSFKAKPKLRALRSARAPKLTGLMSDPLWKKAPGSSGFMNMKNGETPAVKTEIRAVATPSHLYLAARCEEPQPERMKLRVTENNCGNTWSDDCIEFFLDVKGTAEEYAHVQINANGFAFAAWSATGRTISCAVTARAGRYDKGWTVEAAIPMSALGVKAGKRAAWGFHCSRNRAGAGGIYVWSWVGSTNHAPERYGKLVF